MHFVSVYMEFLIKNSHIPRPAITKHVSQNQNFNEKKNKLINTPTNQNGNTEDNESSYTENVLQGTGTRKTTNEKSKITDDNYKWHWYEIENI